VARDIVIHMLSKRPDIREAMAADKYRVGVMALTEMTTGIPEHHNLKKPVANAFNLTEAEKRNYGLSYPCPSVSIRGQHALDFGQLSKNTFLGHGWTRMDTDKKDQPTPPTTTSTGRRPPKPGFGRTTSSPPVTAKSRHPAI
jgi:hypothetical protein